MIYPSIRIEGAILSPELFDRLDELPGQRPADFGLSGSATVKDEIARAWADAQDYWRIFRRKLDTLPENSFATTETRNLWISPLLGLLGYQLEYQQRGPELNAKVYPISHRAANRANTPVHVVGYRDQAGLDRKPERSGGPRMSAHALVQEYLNLSDQLYGVVTNGRLLRLLRDSSRLVKLTYLEFDLDRIFNDGLFADFAVLYRFLHASRLPVTADAAPESLIERYHQNSVESGARIRDGLSRAVESAIRSFANGLLAHPKNDELRAAIQSESLKPDVFYQHLLRLIYRLLFLLVIEERNLVYPLSPSAAKRDLYYRFYSLQRLRRLAEKRHLADPRKDDAWLALMACFRLFEAGGPGPKLGIAPLAGDLFRPDAIGSFRDCQLDNAVTFGCLHSLSLYQNPDTGQTIRVNYAALNVEEFGSVYEGLLEFEPIFRIDGQRVEFAFKQGDERAATGSHYTPDDLVQPLLKHSLDPLIAEKLKEKDKAVALLSLRVADIACGSGHILLAAARRIATELAVVRTGEEQPSPAAFRAAIRDVIRECIYGVDLNPLAVELCKVALWLEAHSPGEPLNFLDHHIKCGNAIVGFARQEEMERGVPDEAFATVAGDDKDVAAAFRRKNKTEREDFARGQKKVNLAPELKAQLDVILSRWREISSLPEHNPAEIDAKKKRYEEFTQGKDAWLLQQIACIPIAQFYLPKTAATKGQLITDEEFRAFLDGHRTPQGQATAAAWALADRKRFFHWFLHFPDIIARGGFDCILGNPPYLGGQALSGTYGHPFCGYVKWEYAPAGLSDLVAYFVRRIFGLLRPGGFTAFITTNSIKDGDVRKDGLEQVIAGGGSINFAVRGIKWPGRANLVISLVSIHRGSWNKPCILDGQQVTKINSFFEEGDAVDAPVNLAPNADRVFQGSIFLGDGFLLTHAEADALRAASIHNAEVISPLINGQELNNKPDQAPGRSIINFRDWPVDRAQRYTDIFSIVEQTVKPERARNNRAVYRDKWWLYAEPRPKLIRTLESITRCFVAARTTKHLNFSETPTDRVFSDALYVFTTDRWDLYAVVQSTIHETWARKYSGALKQDLRYSPSKCFDTFAFPAGQWQTANAKLAEVGNSYHEHRRALMRRLWLGLTDIYNLFHDRELTTAEVARVSKKPTEADNGYQGILQLRALHRELDEAVLAAYGWTGQVTLDHDFHEVETLPENDRVRYTISPAARKEVLRRLLALNHERAAQEQAAAAVTVAKKRARKPKAAKPAIPDELGLGLDLFARAVAAPTGPDFSLFDQSYPATSADQLVCALSLEFIEWRQSLSSDDHLDGLILATHPDLCRVLAPQSASSKIDAMVVPLKSDLATIGSQGLKWTQCVRYLVEHRKALTVQNTANGRPISKGAHFDTVRASLRQGTGGLAAMALTTLDQIRKLEATNSLNPTQLAASRTLTQLHAKYALA
ncbi:Eco57I restriction-modification methylase domain-containing protein [Nibricoccus sp. IMCC34717]|uniref:Eco57I restriction-modification methylase domain-containing protein n=1 Tax=Nibricoccus sp. IMCC34717 TaxID=3034021 RepID=UPI0038502C1A